MASKTIKIDLGHLYIKRLSGYSGSFTLVLEGSRVNKKGDAVHYEIRVVRLDIGNLLCCLRQLQEAVKGHYQEALSMAKRFGVEGVKDG